MPVAVACSSSSGDSTDGTNQAVSGTDSSTDTNITCGSDADPANASALTLRLAHDPDKHLLNITGTQEDGSTITFVADAFSGMTKNNVSTLFFKGTGTIVGGDDKEQEVHSFAIVHPGEDGFADPAARSVSVRFGEAVNAPAVADEAKPALVHAACSSTNTFAAERL